MSIFSKKTAAALVCLVSVFSSAACMGGTLISSVDESKTQVWINVYDGGNGVDWIIKAAEDYNAAHSEGDYVIRIIDKEKFTPAQIITDIVSGTKTAAYYTAEPGIKDMIAQDLLEDISDVYDMKADGEDGKTIGEKMHDLDNVKQVFGGKNGQGLYGMPFSNSFVGLVYEHERFLENGWYNYADGTDAAVTEALAEQGIVYEQRNNGAVYFKSSAGKTNYKDGDRILTPGKDGKYGTYDDGQPITETEWVELLNKIRSRNGYPLLWSGGNNGYVDHIITSVYAQYDGLENYKLFSTYDGTYESPSTGTKTTITPETGNKIFQVSEGLKKGVEFVDTYFTNVSTYIHPFATYNSTSHRDAQDKFVFGFKNEGEVYLTGMLVEGIYWENEARTSFNSVVADGETDRAYGMKEYRYMLPPVFENQKGIDGNGKGSVFSVMDSGAIIVKKNSDRGVVDEVKKFIAYTTSDEVMRYFTKVTGVVRPYDYELSDEDLAEMTPFGRNVWNMFHDTENIATVKPYMNSNLCSINYASTKSKYIYQATYEGVSYIEPLSILKKTDAAGYLNALQASYTDSLWTQLYDRAIQQWGGLN